MIDPDSGRPVYRQLADVIRGQIDRGELRPGQRLRTEPEYVDEYGIGRDSVRKAMALLRAEGLIVTTRQGSRVRPLPDMAEVPLSEDTQIRTRMPTQKERRLLGVPEGGARLRGRAAGRRAGGAGGRQDEAGRQGRAQGRRRGRLNSAGTGTPAIPLPGSRPLAGTAPAPSAALGIGLGAGAATVAQGGFLCGAGIFSDRS